MKKTMRRDPVLPTGALFSVKLKLFVSIEIIFELFWMLYSVMMTSQKEKGVLLYTT